jgi:hypothetical protein
MTDAGKDDVRDAVQLRGPGPVEARNLGCAKCRPRGGPVRSSSRDREHVEARRGPTRRLSIVFCFFKQHTVFFPVFPRMCSSLLSTHGQTDVSCPHQLHSSTTKVRSVWYNKCRLEIWTKRETGNGKCVFFLSHVSHYTQQQPDEARCYESHQRRSWLVPFAFERFLEAILVVGPRARRESPPPGSSGSESHVMGPRARRVEAWGTLVVGRRARPGLGLVVVGRRGLELSWWDGEPVEDSRGLVVGRGARDQVLETPWYERALVRARHLMVRRRARSRPVRILVVPRCPEEPVKAENPRLRARRASGPW